MMRSKYSSSLRRSLLIKTRALVALLACLGMLAIAVDIYFLWPSNDADAKKEGDYRRKISKKKIAGMTMVRRNVTTSRLAQTQRKAHFLDALKEAGVLKDIDEATRAKLPGWEQVVSEYGERPVIVGLDGCETFRANVPAVRRMLGSAGMFSTGTNLVTKLLKMNCEIPERVEKYGTDASKEDHGILWQVAWGKHSPAKYRWTHTAARAGARAKEDVLPIVTIRNPWRWMQSMCKNPYTANWEHRRQRICPRLKTDKDEWNNVTVKYGGGTESYPSLAHLFNEWYVAYEEQTDYPVVMVRMEDLVFRAKETITAVCHCAGGRLVGNPFRYVLESAKADSPGHDTSTGLVEAWIKYSRPLERRAGFVVEDYEAALEALDQNLMDIFHYQHPPSR